jgi:CheY-like chemotaxis protein
MSDAPRGRTILVVDEDPHGLRVLAGLLTAAGHQPVVALGADDAWRKLGRQRFDLALVELAMKQESGIRLIERMKGSGLAAATPVLAVTAPVRRSLARSLGCDGFVFRPVDAEDLCRAVERTCR